MIDNAGFYSIKNIEVPQNIILVRIPPYNPELNPCEQVWQYFKNQRFESMKSLKEWLSETVCEMKPETFKSITGNHHFPKAFNMAYNN